MLAEEPFVPNPEITRSKLHEVTNDLYSKMVDLALSISDLRQKMSKLKKDGQKLLELT